MQIEKYNENQTKILIEHFSDEEYEKFLSVKTLPSYSIIKDSIIINNEFLKEIGINNGYKREKINFQLSDFLWDYQKFIVKLAILKKRFAVFETCPETANSQKACDPKRIRSF